MDLAVFLRVLVFGIVILFSVLRWRVATADFSLVRLLIRHFNRVVVAGWKCGFLLVRARVRVRVLAGCLCRARGLVTFIIAAAV